ncbi:hypothetical protein RIF29_22141 [Crotalaria pallida]|uniref:DUF4378 domain-containing protein n=1 Tax=Crotalaria pallida TaxID=3830 RepID=A0AAN9F8T4_CROPI
MEIIEKKRSKGSFLSFFDWNVKSRKKLFSDTPNLPEVSRQRKENVENMPKSQLNRINVENRGAKDPRSIANCDVNCALSTNSDEGYGTKAPSLVARLMGLDSLPPDSTVSELSSTSLHGSSSLGCCNCYEGAFHSMADYYHVDSHINMPLKMEKSSLVAMETKAQKMAMKRFQSEMLPPKSAKPVPVTHNKLLSPVKSHSYIPPKNAAHIMDAAAKIIEASPQPYIRNRMSSAGPSSVPSRIFGLKDKLEAAHYASELVDLCNAKPVNGKPSERSNNLNKSTLAFKGSRDSDKNGSRHLASKGKSVSLAVPSKDNVHRRDASISNGNSGYMKQKEKNEIKQNQLSRSTKKPVTDRARAVQHKTCTGHNSNVHGLNNQKQNSLTNKEGKSTSKMDSNKPTRTSSSESSTGARNSTNKGAINANIEPKRSSTRVSDTQKEFPVSKRKSVSEKKRYISRDVQNETRGPDNAVNNYESNSIKHFVTTDGSIDQDAFSNTASNDVISFTFTSPLRRNMPESQSSTEQVMETRNRIGVNSLDHSEKLYPRKLSYSPLGLDTIDGDVLSELLEKKIQELASRVKPSQCTLATEGSFAGLGSSLEEKSLSLVSATGTEQEKSFHRGLLGKKLDDMIGNGCSSCDSPVLGMHQQQQTSEPMEGPGCSSSSSGESGNDLNSPHSRAVTDFENPFVYESFLDSEDSSTYGSTVYSFMQGEEVSNSSPIDESASLESRVAWSEKSSSTVAEGNMGIKPLSGMSNLIDFPTSKRNMELEYVKDILSNAELLAEEFVVGQTDKVIMPNLFDVLENHSNGAESYREHSKLERKVLFDATSECLELRCKKAFVGSCKAWPRWMASVKNKSWLAEELYKEMMGFRSIEEEVVVDELVNKDMSTGLGTWLDFDIEAFQEGIDVELDIVTYLINELVSDLLLV